jgi:hypothetical protein
VHYGRYHDELVTSFYDFLDPLSQTQDVLAAVVGPNQFVEEFRYPTTARAAIDPELRFPFAEELVAGVERELPWAMSVKAQFISRDFKDAIGYIDPAEIWLPVQGLDPGPDGRRGTADDGGPVTVFFQQAGVTPAPVLTNPAAYRRYRAVQFIGGRRYSQHVEFNASYTWSRTVGNYNNAYASNAANADLGISGVFANPNKLINTDGRTPQDFTHELKVLGTYELTPLGGARLSGVYRLQSGRPWARSAAFGIQTGGVPIFVEPRGARQTPAVNTMDLRVEKTWKRSSSAAKLGVFVDVFNVWNQGVALRINNASGPNLGVPTQWLDPRTVRAGARVIF